MEEVFCIECDYRFLEGVIATHPPRKPCPQCGSIKRKGTFIEKINIGISTTAIMSATFDRSWKAQYRRMNRAYEQLHGVVSPGKVLYAGEIEDCYINFFQHAWHLKEWLKNDPTSEALTKNIENDINKFPSLQLAADLANGSKHLRLKHSRTGDLSTSMLQADFREHSIEELFATIYVESGDLKQNAYTLAKQVIEDWDKHLSSLGLSSN
jgi:hypothetical protein